MGLKGMVSHTYVLTPAPKDPSSDLTLWSFPVCILQAPGLEEGH